MGKVLVETCWALAHLRPTEDGKTFPGGKDLCCSRKLRISDWGRVGFGWGFYGDVHDQNWLLYDKVTVLESEKRAWENSPDAQAIREALNPWRHIDAEETKKS